MTENNYTVILADGTFPVTEKPLQLLKNAAHIVCCDGAAANFISGRRPDAVVGDMDTLAPELKEYFADIIHTESEQETNDLSKAFRYCLKQGWRNIVILGATGGREDHTLGNIGLLIDFSKIEPDILMVTDDGEFSVAHESGDFSAVPGQAVSIFAPFACTEVTSAGLKYPMNNLKLDSWWRATLNETLGSTFHLDFTSGHPLLIFKAHKQV